MGKPDAGKLARPVWRGLGGNVFREELRAVLPPYAKNLVNQEVGLEKVGALLGHANLNTTRLYITPDERDLEFAVEKLN